MMPQNPFLQRGGVRPMDAQPERSAGDPAMMEWAANQQAEELGVRNAIAGLINEQAQFNRRDATNTAGQGVGTALKEPVKNWLASGGNTTLSSAAVNSQIAPTAADQSVALGASLAAEPGAAGTLTSGIGAAVGPTLGALAIGYNAYNDIGSGLKTGAQISDAQKVGLDPERLARLRGELARQGAAHSNISAASGALGGAAVGSAVAPGIGTGIGAAVGAGVGRVGGELQSIKAYQGSTGSRWGDLAAAAKNRFKHPFG